MTEPYAGPGADVGRIRRVPLGNRIAMAVLTSRWHGPLSRSLLVLRVRGRRSGRLLALPVRYARDGDRLVVLPGSAERKRWWHNLEAGSPVAVLLRGTERSGSGRVIRAGGSGFDAAASLYGSRFPRAAGLAAGSPVLVEIVLDPPGTGDRGRPHE